MITSISDCVGILIKKIFNTCLFGSNNLSLNNIEQLNQIEEHILYY